MLSAVGLDLCPTGMKRNDRSKISCHCASAIRHSATRSHFSPVPSRTVQGAVSRLRPSNAARSSPAGTGSPGFRWPGSRQLVQQSHSAHSRDLVRLRGRSYSTPRRGLIPVFRASRHHGHCHWPPPTPETTRRGNPQERNRDHGDVLNANREDGNNPHARARFLTRVAAVRQCPHLRATETPPGRLYQAAATAPLEDGGARSAAGQSKTQREAEEMLWLHLSAKTTGVFVPSVSASGTTACPLMVSALRAAHIRRSPARVVLTGQQAGTTS